MGRDREYEEPGTGVLIGGATRVDGAFVGLDDRLIILSMGIEARGIGTRNGHCDQPNCGY